ncbi:hypothetical protein [Consotaella aegiceratis]|uniref:hypothetical protein n=1 Tax=Consotaella aegiceratis TaxID=3097961 RepID=UPI002F3F2217
MMAAPLSQVLTTPAAVFRRPAAWRWIVSCGLPALGLVALWLFFRPYVGIVHDARIYIAHTLADHAPKGLGRDLMFAKDGQFGFTLFPVVIAAATDLFGVARGAMLIALAGLLLWFAAFAALACQLVRGPARWAMLLFVVVLPPQYGDFGIFSYGEPFATSRPFAEAGVLAALALLASGHTRLALAPLCVAALCHPIMALPGFLVWGFWVLFELRHRRAAMIALLATGWLAVAVALALAAADAPVLGRLFTAIDPQWLAVLDLRSSYLFLGRWQPEDWALLIARTATVLLAASLPATHHRGLYLGAAAAMLVSFAASFVFGDLLSSLLVVQAQLWRAEWLLSVMAATAFGLCVIELWRRGSASRLALAALILAWLGTDHLMLTAGAAGTALGLLAVALRHRDWRPGRALVLTCWGLTAAFALIDGGLKVYVFAQLIGSRPADMGSGLPTTIKLLHWLAVPLLTTAVIYVAMRKPRWLNPAAALAAILLIAAVPSVWDSRQLRQISVDQAAPEPTLSRVLAERRGEILWIGENYAAWSWSGRPNWVSRLQAASAVFSRPLAMAWNERAERLIAAGLVSQNFREMAPKEYHRERPPLTATILDQFCSADDAPVWVIATLDVVVRGGLAPGRYRTWRAPGPEYALSWDENKHTAAWERIQDFALIPCGAPASPPAS